MSYCFLQNVGGKDIEKTAYEKKRFKVSERMKYVYEQIIKESRISRFGTINFFILLFNASEILGKS